jgi:hypothetical protein
VDDLRRLSLRVLAVWVFVLTALFALQAYFG